jgi:ATP-dependent DNA helicase DinG
VIEAEVHQQLLAFLRQQGQSYWAHHLTMARLVARALRVDRSVLIQTGTHQGQYRLSYLLPVLMWSGPVVLVVPEADQHRLLHIDLPRLKPQLTTHKPVLVSDHWPDPDYQGIVVTTPQNWLRDRLDHLGKFPAEIPTVIDGADDLEDWTRDVMTRSIHPQDWDHLMDALPDQREKLLNLRTQLTHSLYQHPQNPYNCYPLEAEAQGQLIQLGDRHAETSLPGVWSEFLTCCESPQDLLWGTLNREKGQFSLHWAPVEVASVLAGVWAQQPTVLVGEALDLATDAAIYRQRMGLGELTCLKFLPDRNGEAIQLYQPEGIPMPNTPQYQSAMVREVRSLLSVNARGFSVVIVSDTPLKGQLASLLAAEYGSRVRVEQTCLEDHGILITDWNFWRSHQGQLPTPQLLVLTTLPIPSLEDPLVAGRVSYYKHLRQDWFRLFLLPEALSQLQRAIAPVRNAHQGVVALLDSRVIFRSYGEQVLSAMSPFARLNYFDGDLFMDSFRGGTGC